MITAEKTRVFQRTIGALARYKMGPRAPYDQPLVVALRFHISRGGKGRRPSHDVKPDLDNLSKSVLDAFNKIVWVDDARIVRLDSSKVWTDAPQGWFVLEVDTL